MSNFVEMRRFGGQIAAVYRDNNGHDYRIVNGERRYVGGYVANDERDDYCQNCGGNHEPGESNDPDCR